MKRSEMVERLEKDLAGSNLSAGTFLDVLQNVYGMKPPRLPEEYCQALMSIYMCGYSLYQWEEDAEKDEKVVSFIERRRERNEQKRKS